MKRDLRDSFREAVAGNHFVAFLVVLIGLCTLATCARAQIPSAATPYQRLYERIASATWGGLSPPVASLAAQIHQESGWNCQAVSRVGARGCAQFMPATARWIAGFSPSLAAGLVNDPAWAFEAQVRYVRWLFDRAAGDNECERLAFALSAYNGGEARVRVRKARSRAPLVCFRATCGINPGIDPANQRENEDYPVRILKIIDARYANAGWGRKSCAT